MYNKRRLDLDGLRGISVLAVLFYHLNLFSEDKINFSGFIGVDIFFLVSGYVITRSILKKNFDFKVYFENRLRRILLPLLTVILLTTVFSAFYLYKFFSTEEYKIYFETSNSAALFYSNWLFWIKATDYFFQLNLNPYIHTWSLSMELQFYLIAPAILILFKKFRNHIIILIFFISLFIPHLYGSYQREFPFIDFENMNFNLNFVFQTYFLLPARLWEFLLGVMLYIYSFNLSIKNKLFENIPVYLGLILIISSLFLINPKTPIPSIYLLIPLIGASIIIKNYEYKKTVSILLKNKFLQYFSKISYSLYIFHYPVFLFFQNYFFEKFLLIEKFFAILIAILLSHISYIFIEKKSYGKYKINRSKFILISSFLLILSLSLNLFFYKKPNSLNFDKTKFNKKVENIFKESTSTHTDLTIDLFGIDLHQKIINFSGEKTNNVLIIGNSHAQDLFVQLKILEKKLTDIEFGSFHYRKGNELNELFDSEVFKKSSTIILTKRFSLDTAEELSQIDKINNLSLKFNKKFIIVDNSPHFHSYGITPVKHIIKSLGNNKLENSDDLINIINQKLYFLLMKNRDELNLQLQNYALKNNIEFFKNSEVRCEIINKKCFGVDKDLFELYLDYGHLTIKGYLFFSDKIFKKKWLISSLEH